MPFPPETPQDYYDYFFNMQGALPPNPKWAVGLEVARRWLEYYEKDNQELISIIKTFMPYRISGSGFLGLWLQILGYVAKLPINQQKEVWLEIFDTSNQGERVIEHSDEAVYVIQKWVSSNSIRVGENTMAEMVNEVYKYSYTGYEWIGLTRAIDNWFKNYIIDEPSFFSCVNNKLDNQS